jgi:hypothetical protein
MIPGGNPVTEVPGLNPRLPEIVEEPVLVTVLPARIANVLAVPKATGDGELVVANAGWLVLTIPATIITEPMTIGATNATDLRMADILREIELSIICWCFVCWCPRGSG